MVFYLPEFKETIIDVIKGIKFSYELNNVYYLTNK